MEIKFEFKKELENVSSYYIKYWKVIRTYLIIITLIIEMIVNMIVTLMI